MTPDHILTDTQLEELGRLKLGVLKMLELTDRLNALSASISPLIRNVSPAAFLMVSNDISKLVFAHELAKDKQHEEAMQRLERMAA